MTLRRPRPGSQLGPGSPVHQPVLVERSLPADDDGEPAGDGGVGGGSRAAPAVRLRIGRHGPLGRFRRRLVEAWVVAMVVDALVAWGAWQLPVGPGVLLLALCAAGALGLSVAVGLVVAVLSRASVAAGQDWLGFRVLGRWRVVRPPLVPDRPAGPAPGPRRSSGGDPGPPPPW
jgi:hypothetical protein